MMSNVAVLLVLLAYGHAVRLVLQECSFNGDCPLDKACEKHSCEDPCTGLCGNNTMCKVKRHMPVCSCRQGFTGEPMLGCTESVTKECSFNGDCSLDKACEKNRCEDPCLDFCGNNTVCQVKRHTPVCSCREGFIGEPMLGCTDSATQECSFNGDCPLDKACENHRCEDPCLGFCGNNTVCQVKRHAPVCSCLQGFSGAPTLGCTDSAFQGCSYNGDCPLEKACEKHKCEDPCLGFCGNNTVCQVKRHTPVCSCLQGFIGEPMLGCTDSAIKECSFNGDCPMDKACEQNRCEDPCLGFCGNNTVCQVKRHTPVCSCLQGFIGEPMLGCTDSVSTSESTTKISGKKKFTVSTFKVNFTEALKNCHKQGMRLATIENKEQNDDLVADILKAGIDLRSSQPLSYVLIGAMDMNGKGKKEDWYWITTGESTMNYTNWVGVEPTGANEHCLVYWKSKYNGIGWGTHYCSMNLLFACEYY